PLFSFLKRHWFAIISVFLDPNSVLISPSCLRGLILEPCGDFMGGAFLTFLGDEISPQTSCSSGS
ncbi:hypothetical protein STEG23_034324, partial [Scotinomys teguina]